MSRWTVVSVNKDGKPWKTSIEDADADYTLEEVRKGIHAWKMVVDLPDFVVIKNPASGFWEIWVKP